MNLFGATTLLGFSILIVVFWVLIVVLQIVGKRRTRVPFLSTPYPVIDEAFALLEFRDAAQLYDLGSGSGRVLFRAVRKHSGITAHGFEKSPLPYLMFRGAQVLRPRPRVTMTYDSYEAADLSAATHVFLYLFPEEMLLLEEKFAGELSPGTRVVSCDFPFPHKPHALLRNVRYGARTHTLYLYEY